MVPFLDYRLLCMAVDSFFCFWQRSLVMSHCCLLATVVLLTLSVSNGTNFELEVWTVLLLKLGLLLGLVQMESNVKWLQGSYIRHKPIKYLKNNFYLFLFFQLWFSFINKNKCFFLLTFFKSVKFSYKDLSGFINFLNCWIFFQF